MEVECNLFTELMKRHDSRIDESLQEKHKLVAEVLGVPPGDFENVAEVR